MAENTQKIDNSAIIEAIAEMRKAFNAETQNKVINIALKSSFYVPAVLEKNTELVADADNHVKFENKQKAKFLLIKHKDKGSFYPVFTDLESLNQLKSDQKYVPFTMKFSDIAGLTENTPNVAGFVINPFTHNLPFTKEMLESIKQTLIRVKQERDAAKAADEAKAPNITTTTNENA